MKKREWKGNSFLEIKAESISPERPICCNVFVYLPLNERMLCIREASEYFDRNSQKLYLEKGHVRFFVVDPAANPTSYKMQFAVDGLPNPPIPGLHVPMDAAEESSPSAEQKVDPGADGSIQLERAIDRPNASPSGEILTGKGEDFIAGELLGKATQEPEPAPAQEHEATAALAALAAAKTEQDLHKVSADSSGTVEQKFSSEIDPAEDTTSLTSEKEAAHETRIKGGSPKEIDEEQRFSRNAEEEEPEQAFSRDVEGKKTAQQRQLEKKQARAAAEGSAGALEMNSAAKGEEEELRFSSDNLDEQVNRFKKDKKKKEEEEEQSFSMDEAEKEAIRVVKGGDDTPVDESSKRFSSEIAKMEEELVEVSPEGKDFVDEVRKITKDGDSGKGWDYVLRDDAPQLRGLSSEDRAAAKLAHALGKGLGLMRRELNAAARGSIKGTDENAIKERRDALGEKIKKMELTALILESLDDKNIEVTDLPDHLAGKTKIELLDLLEKDIESLSGSKLLSESDAKSLRKKVRQVKARDFSVHGEGISKVRDGVVAKLKALQDAPLSDAERDELNVGVAKEVKAAKMALKITRALTDKRKELRDLLDARPKSKSEAKANEQRAKALQEGIRNLEALNAAVEAGEPLTEKQEKFFSQALGAGFKLREGEDAHAGLTRISGDLASLREEVVNIKMAAAEAETALIEKINRSGEEEESKQGSAFRFLPSAQIESLAQLKSQLDSHRAAADGGQNIDLASLAKIQDQVGNRVGLAAMAMNVERALTTMREELGSVLSENPAGQLPSKEQAARAESLLDRIQRLEMIFEKIEQGDKLSAEEEQEFRAEITASLAFASDRPLGKEFERVAGEVGSFRKQAKTINLGAIKSDEQLLKQIISSNFNSLKERTINTKKIDGDRKQLGRHLKFFQETGKEVSRDDVWEIKRLLEEDVREARVNVNIGKKISSLGAELAEVRGRAQNADADKKLIFNTTLNLTNEIRRIKSIGDAIDRGERLDERVLQEFSEELPDVFRIKGDSLAPEEISKVISALGEIREEVIAAKKAALAVTAELLLPDASDAGSSFRTSEEAEAELLRKVSGAEAKMAQAGVYAAGIFRSFGYLDVELERNIMLAGYLWNYPAEQVKDAFPELVLQVHSAAREEARASEMTVHDMGQAVNLACKYTFLPGVITGKFSIDPEKFSQFCEELQVQPKEGIDLQLLERARQAVFQPLPESDRLKLINMARDVGKSYSKWKQGRSAA